MIALLIENSQWLLIGICAILISAFLIGLVPIKRRKTDSSTEVSTEETAVRSNVLDNDTTETITDQAPGKPQITLVKKGDHLSKSSSASSDSSTSFARSKKSSDSSAQSSHLLQKKKKSPNSGLTGGAGKKKNGKRVYKPQTDSNIPSTASVVETTPSATEAAASQAKSAKPVSNESVKPIASSTIVESGLRKRKQLNRKLVNKKRRQQPILKKRAQSKRRQRKALFDNPMTVLAARSRSKRQT